MNASATVVPRAPGRRLDPDRIGVIASVLCAIHCAIAPVLLLFAPAFGRWWAHPASHWIVALFVVPLAGVMVARGFRIHRKHWVMASGATGILLILAGAALPYTGMAKSGEAEGNAPPAPATVAAAEEANSESAGQGEAAEADCCKDGCCPSIVTDEQNETRLHIPPASIATTIGGLALILAHVGNICCCSTCRKKKQQRGA